MYCSACGSQINNKLNYCNGCGAKLSGRDDDESPKSIFEGLLIALTLILIFGLAFLVGLVAVLLGNDFPFEYVVFIAAAYLFTLGGICFMLLRPVSKLVNARFEKKSRETDETYRPPQLAQSELTRLIEPGERPASVTEHTTRTLEEALVDRN